MLNYNDLEINTYYASNSVEYIVLTKNKEMMIWIAKLNKNFEWNIWVWTKSEWKEYGEVYEQTSEPVGFLEDLFTYEEIFKCLFTNGLR